MDDELKRFGVSMESGLLKRFDSYIKEREYTNRSEAIRDLVRKTLVEDEWVEGESTVGAITIVYDHHVPELSMKLNTLQHEFPGDVISSMHVHLDHHNCMEVIVAKGNPNDIKKLADKITASRGVLHGTLTGSTIGSKFKHGTGNDHTHSHGKHHHSHD